MPRANKFQCKKPEKVSIAKLPKKIVNLPKQRKRIHIKVTCTEL